MDFADKILELAKQAPKRLEHTQTEEATKNAFIMPFITALGYNVFDPTEVVPEYVADVGVKKGEKVDYAILQEGKPIIIIEAKSVNTDLSQTHSSQLYRYFSVTDVRFAILTNGLDYQFYSDIEEPNRMDKKPFLAFNLPNIQQRHITELKRFTKGVFSVDEIVSVAGHLKYTREIKKIIAHQLTEPDDDFMRFFAGKVYTGRMTQSARELFSTITKKALREFINEQINSRLQSALNTAPATDTSEQAIVESDSTVDAPAPIEDVVPEEKSSRKIVTTEDEIEGYFVVKSILREIVDSKRITMRDTQSYCGILLDDNNRKPLCRLHFNRSQKYIGFFDAEKNEDRIAIESIDDIFNHADKLKTTFSYYD